MRHTATIIVAFTLTGCGGISDCGNKPEDAETLRLAPQVNPANPAEMLFDAIVRYRTTIHTNGDPADIYFPDPTAGADRSFPIALLLPGATVDKAHHSTFAATVARYGFVVVVPNHCELLGLRPVPDLRMIDEILAFLSTEDENAASPLAGMIDTEKLMLLGYSFGSGAALAAVQDIFAVPFCSQGFKRPPELVGVVVYAGDLDNPLSSQPIGPIDNAGIPVAIINGQRDSIATPAAAAETFQQIQHPPKALITVLGANHFSLTNTQTPLFPVVDPSPATLDQFIAIETIARWSALFLQAYALANPHALTHLRTTGHTTDQNVRLTLVE